MSFIDTCRNRTAAGTSVFFCKIHKGAGILLSPISEKVFGIGRDHFQGQGKAAGYESAGICLGTPQIKQDGALCLCFFDICCRQMGTMPSDVIFSRNIFILLVCGISLLYFLVSVGRFLYK